MTSRIEKGITIINKSDETKAIDASALGKQSASIPEPIYRYLEQNPEFYWFFEDGGAAIFAELNPQFQPKNRIRYTLEQILRIPLKNRDNWKWDGKHRNPSKDR